MSQPIDAVPRGGAGFLDRTFELYRRAASSRPAIALVAANAVPLAGVLFFGWSLWTILVIYWLENGIIGFWNLPRIVLARGSGPATGLFPMPAYSRIGAAIFFLFHYGIFWFVHGVFVFALPAFAGLAQPATTGGPLPGVIIGPQGPGFGPFDSPVAAAGPFGSIDGTSVAIAGLALFLSHGYSFFASYLAGREYLRASPAGQMGAPYGRVVILHMTILLGAFGIAFLGAPIAALAVFVVLKTAFDLGLQLRAHGAGRALGAVQA